MFGKKGTPSALPKSDKLKTVKPKIDSQTLVEPVTPASKPVEKEKKLSGPQISTSKKEFVDLVQDDPVVEEPASYSKPITTPVERNLEVEKPLIQNSTNPPVSAKIEVQAHIDPISQTSGDKKTIKSMDDGVLVMSDEEIEEEETAENNASNLRLQRARNRIWLDLRDGIDLKALARMKSDEAREEVYSAVEEISRFRNLDLTPTELKKIAKECGDDMLGFGPLEELLEIDGIADIMINGPETIYIEINGKIERSNIKFRDNQ